MGLGFNVLNSESFNLVRKNRLRNFNRPPKYYTINDIKKYIFNIKMNVNKKEIFYETTVIDYLTDSGYELLRDKPRIMGKIPDFLFQKNGELYIVEIQIGRLDTNHIYKTIAYRDFWLMVHDIVPKILLVAESVPDEYLPILAKYDVNFIEVKAKLNDQVNCNKIDKELLLYNILKYFE